METNAKKHTKVNSKFALECKAVSKNYGKYGALDKVSLTVEKGHIAGVLGPDGAGKSTLAKLICSLTTKGEGSILMDGKPVHMEDISYLPEEPFVNGSQRVGDLVEMYKYFYKDFDVKRAVAAFKRIEISLNDKFCYLSRSSIQKIETVLVMCRKAKLYILDEPIASVEPKSRDFVIKTILSGCTGDNGVLVLSSVPAQIEKILDEIYIMYKGEIKLASTAEDILADYGKTVGGFYREAFRC